MTTIKAHVSSVELEARYQTAVDLVGKSHFHALWLLSSGYEVDEVAELLSFSPRWVRALIKRYNEGGAGALGDQRVHNGTKRRSSRPRHWRRSRSGSRRRPMTAGVGRGRRLRAGLPGSTGSDRCTISAGGTR